MGGATFPGTKRMTSAQLEALAVRVCLALEQAFPGARPHMVRPVREKGTHGDLDLVVDASALPLEPREALADALGATASAGHKNAPNMQFVVDGHHVDVVMASPDTYRAACAYFAYGDLGTLVGQVARSMGFTYSFTGLRYRMRDGTRLVEDVLVTTDPAETFEFLGYRPAHVLFEEWQQGFDTVEATFAFAAKSDYFDPSGYQREARNHRQRARDADRPNYARFVAWLEKTKAPRGALADTTRDDHLAGALDRFPEFARRYVETARRYRDSRAAHERLNGHAVSALTGRTGADLGRLMAALASSLPKGFPDKNAYVLAADPDELRAWVKRVHEELQEGAH